MSGEAMGQAHIRADLARQAAQHHLTAQDIERSYAAQIEALSHPRRTMSSPD